MDFSFIEDADQRKTAEDSYKAGLAVDVAAAIEAETSGLKTKNEDLLKEKKATLKLLKKFDGLDIDAAREAMEFLDTNERAKLLKEGKFEDIIAKETSAIKTKLEDQITTLTTERDTFSTERDGFKTRFERKLIKDGIQKAALKAGVTDPGALEDIATKGLNVFSLADDESLESRDKDGNLIKDAGKDVILTPKIWVESLKESNSYYWPPSEGIGAGSSGSTDDLLEAASKAAEAGDMKLFRTLRKKAKEKASK